MFLKFNSKLQMVEDEESDFDEDDDGIDEAQTEEEARQNDEEEEEAGPSTSSEVVSTKQRKYVSHMEWLRFRLRRIWKSKVSPLEPFNIFSICCLSAPIPQHPLYIPSVSTLHYGQCIEGTISKILPRPTKQHTDSQNNKVCFFATIFSNFVTNFQERIL